MPFCAKVPLIEGEVRTVFDAFAELVAAEVIERHGLGDQGSAHALSGLEANGLAVDQWAASY